LAAVLAAAGAAPVWAKAVAAKAVAMVSAAIFFSILNLLDVVWLSCSVGFCSGLAAINAATDAPVSGDG
jgi:hypothetical protein